MNLLFIIYVVVECIFFFQFSALAMMANWYWIPFTMKLCYTSTVKVRKYGMIDVPDFARSKYHMRYGSHNGTHVLTWLMAMFL